tara:strand:- start:730 stop:1392 length:663 start_codon:yes stop_codon:yes gene_type:complete
MKTYTKRTLFLLGLLSVLANALFSQSNNDNVRVKMANLFQDVALLKEQIGQMKLETESLRRDNHQLLKELELTRKSQNQLVEGVNQFFDSMEDRFASLENNSTKELLKGKEDVLTHVNKEMISLAQRTQKAMDLLAAQVQAVNKTKNRSTPKPAPRATSAPKSFNSSYPPNGMAYTIKSGDSLSKIAADLGSKVSYIINANQMLNPNQLKVGDTLFIPVP